MDLKNFKLENLPFTTQLAIIVVLAAALVGAVYVVLLKGMIEEQTAIQTEISQLETTVAQGTAIASQLGRFKQELAKLEARLEELRSILPAQKETPQILRNVQDMASDSELRILRFVPQPVVPRAFYSDWPIQLEVEGNYDALGRFFERVGGATRIINVENINVKGIERTENNPHTLRAVCTATTFVFREEQVVPAGR
jgi:type IV pilus assembly protein PilO